MANNSNESRIWSYLRSKGLNEYGTAGLMGNLFAESGLNPKNLQNTGNTKLKMSDEEYTAAVDNGQYRNFVEDKHGYGLAQWTFWARKQGLLDFIENRRCSIGDLEAQLDYILLELKESYASVLRVLRNATSVLEASSAVLLKYERPADQSLPVIEKRAQYGEAYYDKYTIKKGSDGMTAIERLLRTAKEEVGYLEKASNSQLDSKTANIGRNNYTKFARDLDELGVYNFPKNGYAWCDIFVDWCFVKTFGYKLAWQMTNQQMGGCGAGCTQSAQYYKKMNRFFYDPEPGDQIFFKSSESEMSHTGLVEKIENGRVYTIEGNTSSDLGVVANGGSVNKKNYSLTYAKIGGYGRPLWSLVEDVDEEDEIMDVARFTELWLEMRKTLKDNDSAAYSQEARDWAVSSGLMQGGNGSDGTPNYMWEDTLTREQFVTVLHRFAKLMGKA